MACNLSFIIKSEKVTGNHVQCICGCISETVLIKDVLTTAYLIAALAVTLGVQGHLSIAVFFQIGCFVIPIFLLISASLRPSGV